MKWKNIVLVTLLICFLILCLSACSKKSDPDLNKEYYKNYSYNDSEYYWYYREKFENLSIETTGLRFGLDWFVITYDDVYTGETEYFYSQAFDSGSIYTRDLVSLYNKDPDRLYYLKPFLDCYLLMDNNKKPTDEELKTIKETILYALDYYINGKDFVGMLDE